jgi:tetratricopeptide (TPR) repeat protein
MPSEGFFKMFFSKNIPKLNSYSDIYNLAFEYVSHNKDKRHIRKILEQALTLNISINEEDIFHLHFIASKLVGFRKFKGVKIICHKIVEVEPHDYQAISFLLNIAIYEKDRVKIISYCNALLESDYPNYIKNYLQDTLMSSIPEIRNSIKRLADRFHDTAGIILREKNDYKKAMRGYEIAFEIDPSSLESHHNIGIMLYKLKRYSEAIKYFEKDVELIESTSSKDYQNPTALKKMKDVFLSRYYFNIGKSYFRLGQLIKCQIYLEKSVVLDGKNKNIDEAINEFLSIFEDTPEL